MELKLKSDTLWGVKNCRSNRTFMELKQQKTVQKQQARERSNRTFMELKHGSIRRMNTTEESSNRTFMELKQLWGNKIAHNEAMF